MRRIGLLFLSVLFVLPLATNAQAVDISVRVLQAFSPQAKLSVFNGNGFTPVDSSLQLSQGYYKFSLSKGYPKGIYRVEVGKNIKFNIVVSNEPVIDVNTVVFAPEDSLKSTQSVENNLYWRYQKKKKIHSQQSWLIASLMDYYSDTSTFRNELREELSRIDISLHSYAEQLITSSPNLLASQLVRLEQKPVLESNREYKPNELISLWWSKINLHNPVITHSPALPERVWQYMDHFFNDDLDKEQQDIEFTRGVHTLLSLPMSLDVKSNLRDILVDGFANSDYHDVYEYLVYTSFGELEPLEESKPIQTSEKKVRARVGDKAYDFTIVPLDGEFTKLSAVDADYKLVLFWSSWCPHCIDEMPQIIEVYNKYKDKGFEVVGVSLDDDANAWEHYVRDLNLDWINVRIPYTEDELVYSIYDVHETPRMFLLSRDLEIISRPSTTRQLEAKLRRQLRP
jgi:thiol-disulfide isomerase/thioredoxin